VDRLSKRDGDQSAIRFLEGIMKKEKWEIGKAILKWIAAVVSLPITIPLLLLQTLILSVAVSLAGKPNAERSASWMRLSNQTRGTTEESTEVKKTLVNAFSKVA
jgi:hypothetical protein